MKAPLGLWILGLLWCAVVSALIFATDTPPAIYLVSLALVAAFVIAVIAIARR
jgi:hypothetical protein